MDYVSYIRGLVGSQAIILTGVVAVVRDDDGDLLMHKRSDNGLWSFPGGFMEMGETWQETATREVLEETGYEIDSCELSDVLSGPKLFHEYSNGDKVWNITIVATARIAAAHGVPSQETTSLAWINPGRISEYALSPPTVEQWKSISRQVGFGSPR